MQIHVLGSSAGGGFPQWNCNCRCCRAARDGSLPVTARSQSSICVGSDGTHWVLINASPDIRQQILAFPPLQPARSVRDTGIVGVVLVDSQIDHTAGLPVLRELGRPLPVYCTEMVRQDLTGGFPLLTLLQDYCGSRWHEIPVRDAVTGVELRVAGVEGISFTAVPLSGKAPPYSPHCHDPHPGDNIGLWMCDEATGGCAFYAPGLAAVEPHLHAYLQRADCILVDGTFWTEDELQRAGVGTKTAAAMGHLPQSGPGGMIAVLEPYRTARRILIHINNTNPILNERGAERAQLTAAGIEVALDGMDIRV
jgi:pyrroloquinoline quinone biosynthesis protein B